MTRRYCSSKHGLEQDLAVQCGSELYDTGTVKQFHFPQHHSEWVERNHRDNYLQATSAYFLNDSTEVTYGCKILSGVLDEWISNNSRNGEALSLGLVRELRQSFGEDLFRMNLIKPVYLAFSVKTITS